MRPPPRALRARHRTRAWGFGVGAAPCGLLPVIVAAALVGLLLPLAAHAKTVRYALVVGHNTGSEERKPLRFAESDAGKVARTLADVGGVAPEDLVLLQGRPQAEVERALAEIKAHIKTQRRNPDTRSILIFYYSGHSDGEALELGPERLSFERLHRLLAGTGADVRLLIIDACKSGGAITERGGRAVAPFAIRLIDDLSTKGEVTLASSAADEVALESAEVRGGLFTHHFVSALRGAADDSGDGMVTLSEAYRYSYARTVASSAATLSGPHHPAFRFSLSGQGELVLSELHSRMAELKLPGGFDRALVIDSVRDLVLVELGPASARTVALPQGSYGIRMQRQDEALGLRLTLAERETRELRWEELQPLTTERFVAAKGEAVTTALSAGQQGATHTGPGTAALTDAASRTGIPLSLELAGGAGTGIGAGLTAANVRLTLGWGRPAGPTAAVTASTGRGDAYNEHAVHLRGGYRMGWGGERFAMALAIEAVAGLSWQVVANDISGASLVGGVAPRFDVGVRLASDLWLGLAGEALLAVAKVDGEPAFMLVPAVVGGLRLEI